MEIDSPADAIRNRMEALHLRHAIVFPEHTPPKGALIEAFAEEIAERLKRFDDLAVTVMWALIDAADQLPDSAFWSTSLGRLLFAAGGYRHEVMPQATAAAVLGVSRQYVHTLIMSGHLHSETDVNPASRAVRIRGVQRMLRERLDKLVN